MAEFQNVSKSYDGVTVIDDFSLTLQKGDHVAIMGESGSGKTTLLSIAAGLTSPDSGSFTHDGKIAVMFQEPRLLPWKTALENVRAVLKKDFYRLADTYLSAVGLGADGEKMPAQLSGGMAQRVSFARFLAYAEATDADLLLLDEPFSALDDETGAKMLNLLKTFAKGKTLLLITHDKQDAEAFTDKIVKL